MARRFTSVRRSPLPGVPAVRMLGVGAVAFLPEAAKGVPSVSAAAFPYLLLLAYGVNMVILVVFGILGFRHGTGTWPEDGDGGGGSKRPDPEPSPPTGELPTEDYPSRSGPLREAEPEPDSADQRDRVPVGAPR
jgi:hypothetical protein